MNKTALQIFDIEALFETQGMLSPNLSQEYTALAPDSKGPWTFAKLKEHNLKNRLPKGINPNMLFGFTIGTHLSTFSLKRLSTDRLS